MISRLLNAEVDEDVPEQEEPKERFLQVVDVRAGLRLLYVSRPPLEEVACLFYFM